MATIDSKKISQQLGQKYQFSNNTFERLVKTAPKDPIQVWVGDDKQPDFKPQYKVRRWGEVDFSIRAEEHSLATVEMVGEKIVYKHPKFDVEMFDEPGAGEDGGFEFQWKLYGVPDSNVLKATIVTDGLNFFFQPPLTQQEIDEGASRPENVVGSYAVYHATKGGMNDIAGMEYKVGKAFHIFRPKVTDANGVETWGELNIDEQNGLLTVTIDQTWLDNAVYPVMVDPTFGYTSIGVTESNNYDTVRSYVTSALSSNGTLDKISYYSASFDAGSDRFKGAVYSISGSTGTLVASTAEVILSSSTLAWVDSNFSSEAVSSGTVYYAVTNGGQDSSNAIKIRYDSIAGQSRFGTVSGDDYTNGSYTFPTPFTFNNGASVFSIYATYTAEGGSASQSP